MTRIDYLLAELRCALLRARLWQADIEAVGIALKNGLIEPEQALERLDDCEALHLVGSVREEDWHEHHPPPLPNRHRRRLRASRRARRQLHPTRRSDRFRQDRHRLGKIQRFLSQPFFVAEVFTGSPGKYVSLKDTIKAFNMIANGECDALPEQAFYMVGPIEEAFEKAKTLQ